MTYVQPFGTPTGAPRLPWLDLGRGNRWAARWEHPAVHDENRSHLLAAAAVEEDNGTPTSRVPRRASGGQTPIGAPLVRDPDASVLRPGRVRRAGRRAALGACSGRANARVLVTTKACTNPAMA